MIGVLFITDLLIAQEIEPRLYAALPTRMNVIGIAYGFSSGNVLTDPALPIEGLKITGHNVSGVYVRTFNMAKKLGRVQLTVPSMFMSGKAKLNGVDTSVARGGLSDVRLRFSVNLFGTPAYERKDFVKYSEKTIVGVSFVTSIPTGLYFSDKRVNVGANRWAFKPEIGVSKKMNRIYAEAFSGVWFYAKNTDYLSGKVLKQEPVFSIQAHVTYYFKNRMGLSASGTWFDGGQTIVNDVAMGGQLDNWRMGVTWSIPLSPRQSLRLQAHTGAFTTQGYDYDLVMLVYQHIFFSDKE